MPDATQQPACQCGAAPTLIFACSGAADVGHISDLAARQLTAEGVGQMFCLAGIGGRVSGIVGSTHAAAAVLAIDGCPMDCARKSLEGASFSEFEHMRVTDLDMEKGQTPATPESVAKVVNRGRTLLAALEGET